MIEDFYAVSIDEFRKKYLVEKNLDKSYKPRLGGRLSQAATKLNLKNAEQLNLWGTKIHNKIATYVRKIRRANPHITITVRKIPMEDWRTQSASIIVVDIVRTPRDEEDQGRWQSEIEITVLDDNATLVRLGDPIAEIVNRGNHRKAIGDKNKVAGYVISVLERML